MTQGYFNSEYGADPFAMVGASFEYMRRIRSDLSMGMNLGVDYSPSRIVYDRISYSTSILYNKIAFLVGYYF